MKNILLALMMLSITLLADAVVKPSADTTALQTRIEKIATFMTKELQAKNILITIMETQSAKIITMASSAEILKINADEYSFEPGAVMKPIVLSLLLDYNKTHTYDLVNGDNGHYVLDGKVIMDEEKFGWISVEDAIIYSSNIAIAKLSQNLNSSELHQGLRNFGFNRGIPSIKQFNTPLYKAVVSYGYSISINQLQLLEAYNTFNNSGCMVIPASLDKEAKTNQIISKNTAAQMKNILIKTVNKGIAKDASISGLIIGGMAGVARIAENGRYVNNYNSSFVGFANDKTHRYSIAVTVVEPLSDNSTLSATTIFKKSVEAMVKEGFLIKSRFKHQGSQR